MDELYGTPQYPELYYRMYPMIEDSISRFLRDNPVDSDLTDEQVQDMVDEIYERMIRECPEIDMDPDERGGRRTQDIGAQQRPFYGRRRLSRDLITLILLSRLFDRRRRRRRSPFYDYGYPGYGYPGYGYPGYGYPGY